MCSIVFVRVEELYEKLPMRNQFPWKMALSVYVAAYGLMFTFLDAYFWDDWFVYYNEPDSAIKHLLRIRGDWPTRAALELTILDARPELFRVLTFIVYFAIGWFVFRILSTLRFLTNEQVRLITLFFLVLPINSARVAMVDFAYAFSLLLFFGAWFLLVTRKSFFFQVVGLILFVLSFGATASLLVFLVAPCAHRLYLRLSDSALSPGRTWMSCVAFFFLSPAFWFLDRQFNSPEGAYLQMYSIQKSGFLRVLLLGMLSVIILLWYWKFGRHDSNDAGRYLLISMGLVLIILGAAPYIVAGHLVDASAWLLNFVPRASQWDSRHQLLLGLGLSTLFAGILGETNSTYKRRLSHVLIALFVLLNLTYMHSYFLDSMKQKEVMSAIESNSEMKDARVIMIDDLTTDRYNARGRDIRSYEWDAMFSSVYHDDLRKSIVGYNFVDCDSGLIPDTLLTITATNGRFKATLFRQVGINIGVARIDPCP